MGDILAGGEEFKYLRTLLSANVYLEKDILTKCGTAKAIFHKMGTVLVGELKQELEKRLIRHLGVECVKVRITKERFKESKRYKTGSIFMWVRRKMERVK